MRLADFFRQEDKIKHIVISAGLVLLFSLLLPLTAVIILVMLIGTGKELLDKYYYKSGFCWFDMLANVAGCLLGLLLLGVWHLPALGAALPAVS